MPSIYEITVEFQDGKIEVYRSEYRSRVEEGCLFVRMTNASIIIPLTSIRMVDVSEGDNV